MQVDCSLDGEAWNRKRILSSWALHFVVEDVDGVV